MLCSEIPLSWRIGKFVFTTLQLLAQWTSKEPGLLLLFLSGQEGLNIPTFAFVQKCIGLCFSLGVLWASSGAAGFKWAMQKEVWETIMSTPVLFIEDCGTMKDGKYRGKFSLFWVCLTDPGHFHLENKHLLHPSLCWICTMPWPARKILKSRNTWWGYPWQGRPKRQERDTQPLPMGMLIVCSYLQGFLWLPRALLLPAYMIPTFWMMLTWSWALST